jgi:hypothetical protein
MNLNPINYYNPIIVPLIKILDLPLQMWSSSFKDMVHRAHQAPSSGAPISDNIPLCPSFHLSPPLPLLNLSHRDAGHRRLPRLCTLNFSNSFWMMALDASHASSGSTLSKRPPMRIRRLRSCNIMPGWWGWGSGWESEAGMITLYRGQLCSRSLWRICW